MAVLDQDIYIGGSNGNVFDLNAWKECSVYSGSMTVAGDVVVLSSDDSGSAYTRGGSYYPEAAKIFVHPGEKVKATWTGLYETGQFLFRYNGTRIAVARSNVGLLEYIVEDDITYVEVAISTLNANEACGFGNIQIEIEPLFHFQNDEISDPESIQSVDLIEEKLPIDTFTPIVYYEVGSRKNWFNFNEWSYVAVENGSKTTDFNRFTLTATDDNCYTVFTEDEYPPEARIPVSEGEIIVMSWTATGALGAVRICPEGVSINAVTAISAAGELTYDVGPDITYITVSFSVENANQTVTFSDVAIKKAIGAPDAIRELPFGTPVRYYIADELVHKFYIRSVERVSRTGFKLDCVSAVGILDKVYHAGGVYLGTPFSEIISEMISGILEYTIDSDVANTKIFGYLPYAKARENLHQLMFATNATILKNTSGDMRFTFLNNEEITSNIDSNRIYIDGSVEYPTVATEVQLTEHSFQYDDTIDYVTLIDNTNSRPVDHKVYIFDNAPIVVESMLASETLTVHYAHPNYAIVSGVGILQGIPYYDRTSTISKTRPTSGENYTVKAGDVTVVTALNSENIIERLMTYYTSAKIVKGDIKLSAERTGYRYRFLDTFNEMVIGYLKKIVTYSSSFIKAACEFVTGYISNKFGNNYSYHAVMTGPGILQVPEGTKLIRFTIIGGGDGGNSGLAGSEPDRFSTTGGQGGQGGESGNGGYIKEVTLINPEPGEYQVTVGVGGHGTTENESTEDYLLGGTGTHTYITTPGGVTYSSADNDAYRCESGVMDLFTGIVYARKGREGIKGGNGGRGSQSGPGEAGESITYRGIVREGGKGGDGYPFTFAHIDQASGAGGAGGCGAQAYANGIDGGAASMYSYDDLTSQMGSRQKSWEEAVFVRGCPGTPVPVYDTSRIYQLGDGGDAGHGGAGRGGWGDVLSCELLYDDADGKAVHTYGQPIATDNRTAYSSKGLKGDPGQNGCIIIYSDKPVSYGTVTLDTPTITNTSTTQQASFSFVNVGNNVSYQIERRMIWSYITNMGRQLGSWVIIDEEQYAVSGETYEYIDATAEITSSYEYRIKAVGHGAAIDSQYSNVIVAGSGATQLNSPVLTGESTYFGGQYSWEPVEGAEMYLIASKLHSSDEWGYRWWQRSSDDYTYAIVEEDGGAAYDFMICAGSEDTTHIASQWSNIVTITMPQQGKVQKPAIYINPLYGAMITAGQGISIKVEWTVPRNADYIVIERKSPSDSSWTQVGVQQCEVYQVTAGQSVRQYYYYDSGINTSHGDIWQYRVKAFKDGWIDSDYSDVYEYTVNLKLQTPTLVSLEKVDPQNPPPEFGGVPWDAYTSDENVLAVRWTYTDNRTRRIGIWVHNTSDPQTTQLTASTAATAGIFMITGPSILKGGTIEIALYALDDVISYEGTQYYVPSDPSPVPAATITLPVRTYYYDAYSYKSNAGTPRGDPSGLTGGWKNGRDSSSGTLSYSTDADGQMVMEAGGSSSGYRITTNPISLIGYSRLYMIGKLVKPSRDAQSRFGTCRYTGDNTGVGCWSLKYDSLGTYATGTLTNPSTGSFTTNNDTHIMLFMSQSGSATVNRIFAMKS